MKITEIIEALEELSPSSVACGWDNPGLLVGSFDAEVKKVYLSLDADMAAIDDAIEAGADMIITHHPMIFSSIKKVNSSTALGRKILKLAGAGVAEYAMHTNFDIKGMSQFAAEKMGYDTDEILEETSEGEGIGRIATLDSAVTLEELAKQVKAAYGLDFVTVYGDLGTQIKRVAISPGSGKSMIDVSVEKGVDCLVTGDFGHHEALDAIDDGLAVIDATHAGIERIFIEYMEKYLSDKFGDAIEIVCRDINLTMPGTIV